MPDKDPSNLFELIASVPEPFKAAVLSFFVALIRILYDGKEPRWTRKLIEAALCGAITLSVVYLTRYLGLAEGLGIFLGGAIGLFGADQVREWGRHMAEKRVR